MNKEKYFFFFHGDRRRLLLSFLIAFVAMLTIFSLIWNIILNKKLQGEGVDFEAVPLIAEQKRNKEQVVRLMIRQQSSTPKKAISSFKAQAISDIQAPDHNIQLNVEDIAPNVTPGISKAVSLNNQLNFSVFKFGNFMTRLRRAGAKKGFITISLVWDNQNDLDLHCIGPNEEEIFYSRKKGKLGELDVDMNAGEQRSNEPVENLYFPKKTKGKYSIFVNHYSNNGGNDPTKFSVLVQVEGMRERRFKGMLSSGDAKKEIYAFYIQ